MISLALIVLALHLVAQYQARDSPPPPARTTRPGDPCPSWVALPAGLAIALLGVLVAFLVDPAARTLIARLFD
jgi:hypothetical protein